MKAVVYARFSSESPSTATTESPAPAAKATLPTKGIGSAAASRPSRW